MDFYEKNGIIPYINAHDTYTVYGGSRMAENTLQAMKEAADFLCGSQANADSIRKEGGRINRK